MKEMSEEEIIETIEELKDGVERYGFDYTVEEAVVINKNEYNAIQGLLDLYKQEKESNNNAKWYANQMIVRIYEDIVDYVDDGEKENENIIGELKETKKQWKDIEKLLNGESKDNLYNDWRKYGEYE